MSFAALFLCRCRPLLALGWLLGGLFLGGCAPHTAVYVLPDAFEGNVAIVFDQPDGVSPEDAEGCRVYRIPRSGVLKTTAEFDPSGYAEILFCYAAQFRGRHSTPDTAWLPYVHAQQPALAGRDATDIVCFDGVPFTKGKVYGQVFTVSSVANADSIYQKRAEFTQQAFL